VGASPRRCAPGDGRDRVGVDSSGSMVEAVRPVVEMNGRSDAPVVGGSEEEVGMLLGSVGKLGVGPIKVEKGRRGVFHGEPKAAAGGDRRHTSESRCGTQRDQLRGCRASRGRKVTG
jgi:hypothetical protein